jgi:hypothetical protein
LNDEQQQEHLFHWEPTTRVDGTYEKRTGQMSKETDAAFVPEYMYHWYIFLQLVVVLTPPPPTRVTCTCNKSVVHVVKIYVKIINKINQKK